MIRVDLEDRSVRVGKNRKEQKVLRDSHAESRVQESPPRNDYLNDKKKVVKVAVFSFGIAPCKLVRFGTRLCR